MQGNKEEERLSLNPERDFFLFFSWCCGFFMIGYVVFFSRSFSFFYSSSHSYQILENVIFCSVGLQILILIAAGLQIQQNKGIHLFGRICNPTVTNTSIFNARKQQAANKHTSKMWGVVYVADYKSLYS